MINTKYLEIRNTSRPLFHSALGPGPASNIFHSEGVYSRKKTEAERHPPTALGLFALRNYIIGFLRSDVRHKM